ncbi:CatA-like O-acetyltransferase [Desulfovibrio inopinatus]|uniref:CatA-like O-acetyltransferase n=1 Tax=Desulfovibrio inopinatus TaxID=102109 RepID=UPI00042096C8|nr:CatA-like O-acetyltransferase [Desulfovibrio inopinatus]
MKEIDVTTWPRKSIYDFFRQLAHPQYSLTVNLDAHAVMTVAKPAGVRPFQAVLYAIMEAANAVPEMRQRMRDNGQRVVEHDRIHPGITAPISGDRFAFCCFDHDPDWNVFQPRCAHAMEEAQQQTELYNCGMGRDDYLYLSCAPWTVFTSLHQVYGDAGDCAPRVVWGKIHQDNGKWLVPVAVQAHHALVDGLHVARFHEYLQEQLDAWSSPPRTV